MTAAEVQADLRAVATPAKAKASAWFFKTGPGQYGEGDQFIGVTLPEQRAVARRYRHLPLAEVEQLVTSSIHEERLTGLIILVDQYKRGNEQTRQAIFDFYLAHTDSVNNWDLVDSSAHLIVGPQVQATGNQALLDNLAASGSLWERRIAMIATAHFIRQNVYAPTLRIAAKLLGDRHDLIHKAVGWMLREVGKHNLSTLENFLVAHYHQMPRTMLRYAIEKLPEARRQAYLKGQL